MQKLSDENPKVTVGKRLAGHRIQKGICAEKMYEDFGITWGT